MNEVTKLIGNAVCSGVVDYSAKMSLRSSTRSVPNAQGIYLVVSSKDGQLVYFGKAGGKRKNGRPIVQGLFGRINNRCSNARLGIKDWSREKYFRRRMDDEKIDELRIFWYQTIENPLDIEQRLYRHFGASLPRWNEKLGRKK